MKPELASFQFNLGESTAGTPTGMLADQLHRLPVAALPLQSGCMQGGWADTNNARLTMIRAVSDERGLQVTIMAYYEEIVGGCNCSEDPVHYPAMLRLRVSVGPDGFITALEPLPD